IWTALKAFISASDTREPDGENIRAMLDQLWATPSVDESVLAACIQHQPNRNPFDFVPANLELSESEIALVSAVNRERILMNVLMPLRDAGRYDYILIDCPPHLGMLTVNALTAVDAVMIPVSADYLSTKGMNELFRSIVTIRRTLNPQLEVLGI